MGVPVVPDDGAAAVRLARRAIAKAIGAPTENVPVAYPELFTERRGVFVTLSDSFSGALRGCIGFPRAVMPLAPAVEQAAVAAATQDPRFPPVTPEELEGLVVEVSILGAPEPVPFQTPEERPRGVFIGVHGLIVETSRGGGLLLPQVAVDEGWSSMRFLEETCRKAGLPPTAWTRADVGVQRFTAELFSEESPGGRVRARTLTSGRDE